MSTLLRYESQCEHHQSCGSSYRRHTRFVHPVSLISRLCERFDCFELTICSHLYIHIMDVKRYMNIASVITTVLYQSSKGGRSSARPSKFG